MADPHRSIRARIEALVDLHRDDEVVALARQGLATAPDDPFLLGHLALAAQRADPLASKLAAEQAVAAAPDDEWVHRVAAIVLLNHGKAKQARVHAERAAALAPMSPNAQVVLSRARSATGDHRGASTAAQETVRLAPHWSGGHVELSRQALRAREWRIAGEHARRALEIDPTDPAARNNLGVALERLGLRTHALELFAEAAAADPRDDVAATNARRSARSLGSVGVAGFGLVGLFFAARAALYANTAVGIVLFLAVAALTAVISRRRFERDIQGLPPHLQDFARQERRSGGRPRGGAPLATRRARLLAAALAFAVVGALAATAWSDDDDRDGRRDQLPPIDADDPCFVVGGGATICISVPAPDGPGRSPD